MEKLGVKSTETLDFGSLIDFVETRLRETIAVVADAETFVVTASVAGKVKALRLETDFAEQTDWRFEQMYSAGTDIQHLGKLQCFEPSLGAGRLARMDCFLRLGRLYCY